MISPVKIWRRQKRTIKYLNKTGRVLAWTNIRVAATEFKKYAPYPVVLVELDNKKRIYGQLVDYQYDGIKIGLRVKSVIRKIRHPEDNSVIAYGIKFKPI